MFHKGDRFTFHSKSSRRNVSSVSVKCSESKHVYFFGGSSYLQVPFVDDEAFLAFMGGLASMLGVKTSISLQPSAEVVLIEEPSQERSDLIVALLQGTMGGRRKANRKTLSVVRGGEVF